MSIPNGFRVSIGDDPEYKDLTAEIYYHETFLALINQDQGFDNLIINIYPKESEDYWSFPMNDFC